VRICLDLSPAVHRRGGIGRYAGELAAALMVLADGEAPGDRAEDDRVEVIRPKDGAGERPQGAETYIAFYNDARSARLDPPFDRLPRIAIPAGNKPWRLAVMAAHWARRSQAIGFAGVDVFHGTDHLLPYLPGLGRVLSVHDLTFRLFPSTHTPLNRWFLRSMLPRFLRHAHAVVVDSASTRRDLLRFHPIDPGKVHTIPLGVARRFRPAPPDAIAAVRATYGLPDRFILSVGTLEPRKNLPVALAAYREIRARGLPHRLVLAGPRGWLGEGLENRLRELGLEGEVDFPGYVADADLPALYSAADAFAFPSLYEGFGLPPLEAMACGTPVIASEVSAIPEVVGDAGLLVRPDDVSAWAAAISRVVEAAEDGGLNLRSTMRAKGLARAAAFTWERTARATLAVYRLASDASRR